MPDGIQPGNQPCMLPAVKLRWRFIMYAAQLCWHIDHHNAVRGQKIRGEN